MTVQIHGVGERPLADEILPVRVTGLPADTPVTVVARLSGYRGADWRSEATYASDADGVVDLAAAGDPMSLWWDMTPVAGTVGQSDDPTAAALPAALDVLVGGETVAGVEFSRAFAAPGVRRIDLSDDGLSGALFLPPGDGPHPGVVTLAGSGGGILASEAALLASRGFAALALAYFNFPGRPAQLAGQPLEYFGAALDWLARQPAVSPGALAVKGNSRGGELALLVGAHFPQVGAVVSVAGSGIAWGAIESQNADGPAWTVAGQPVPYVNLTLAEIKSGISFTGGAIEYTPAYRKAMATKDLAAARIPVERIRGGVLLCSGTADAVWPSTELSELAAERLGTGGYPYEHRIFEGAGHLIGSLPYLPTPASVRHRVVPVDVAFGGTRAANAAASAEVWRRSNAFLAEQLGADALSR
jgi:dienelactone hydrolase